MPLNPDIRIAGFAPRFQCMHCEQPVSEVVPIVDPQAMILSQTFRASCRCDWGREHPNTLVDIEIPVKFFQHIPQHWRLDHLTFVVGFEGDWTIKLRNYDWLLLRDHSFWSAFGRFHQEQLGSLFKRTYFGPGMQYGLDSAYFDLINIPHDIQFPAEFWFPTEKMRHSAANRANPHGEM